MRILPTLSLALDLIAIIGLITIAALVEEEESV